MTNFELATKILKDAIYMLDLEDYEKEFEDKSVASIMIISAFALMDYHVEKCDTINKLEEIILKLNNDIDPLYREDVKLGMRQMNLLVDYEIGNLKQHYQEEWKKYFEKWDKLYRDAKENAKLVDSVMEKFCVPEDTQGEREDKTDEAD